MKKSLVFLAALTLAAVAGAQNLPVPTATGYHGVNDTRGLFTAQTNIKVEGDGSGVSHVEAGGNIHANGAIAVTPAALAINGDVGGAMKVVAYTVTTGPGVTQASANGGSWVDGAWNAQAALVTPHGAAALDVKIDGGTGVGGNAVRYGIDAHVDAGKNQDGVAVGSFGATVAASTTLSQTPIPGGASLATETIVATTNHASAATGPVTFSDGVPPGQTAAPRWSQAGADVVVQSVATDPLAK